MTQPDPTDMSGWTKEQIEESRNALRKAMEGNLRRDRDYDLAVRTAALEVAVQAAQLPLLVVSNEGRGSSDSLLGLAARFEHYLRTGSTE